jgi:hypothetical protein
LVAAETGECGVDRFDVLARFRDPESSTVMRGAAEETAATANATNNARRAVAHLLMPWIVPPECFEAKRTA